jgi:hypothetical protein
VPERPKGADCKSAGVRLRRFESSPPHWWHRTFKQKLSQGSVGGFSPARPAGKGGNSSVGRASAFQAEGRGFESRFPLQPMGIGSLAHVAQAVEHFLGKEEVTGSIPVVSSGSSLRDVVGVSAV